MKIINNKNASQNWAPDTMPFFILYTMAIGFLVVSFFLITSFFISKESQLRGGLEETILIERFYNSPECFVHQDAASGRVYQKTIDWDKFTEKNIVANACIPSASLKHAFKLELSNPEKTSKFAVKTPNWADSPNFRTLQKNIFVYDKGGIKNEVLLISIQNA